MGRAKHKEKGTGTFHFASTEQCHTNPCDQGNLVTEGNESTTLNKDSQIKLDNSFNTTYVFNKCVTV